MGLVGALFGIPLGIELEVGNGECVCEGVGKLQVVAMEMLVKIHWIHIPSGMNRTDCQMTFQITQTKTHLYVQYYPKNMK